MCSKFHSEGIKDLLLFCKPNESCRWYISLILHKCWCWMIFVMLSGNKVVWEWAVNWNIDGHYWYFNFSLFDMFFKKTLFQDVRAVIICCIARKHRKIEAQWKSKHSEIHLGLVGHNCADSKTNVKGILSIDNFSQNREKNVFRGIPQIYLKLVSAIFLKFIIHLI